MRVDFLFPRVSKRVRAVMDSIAFMCGIVVCGGIIWYSIPIFWYSWSIREVTDGVMSFPVYVFKSLVVVGTGLLGVQLLLDLVGTIKGSKIVQ